MAFEIKGKAALVTGGTEGIGLALTKRLLEGGASVMVANRNAELANQVLADIKKEMPNVEVAFVKMDANVTDDVKNAFKATVDKFGSADIVVANAGFSCQTFISEIEQEKDDEWMRGVNGNLVGTMLLGRVASSYWLKEDKAGSFVVTSSVAGLYPNSHPCMSYAVTKAAQMQFINNLQIQLDQKAGGKSKIRCASIGPGMTWTAIFQKGRFANRGIEGPQDLLDKDEGYRKIVNAVGGWTPMDKLIDAYILAITSDEHGRGKNWIVCGAGGEPKQYPQSFNLQDYVSRAE